MKNYYEILAYADREDLLIEKTNRDTYIGFKDGENSKTLFKFSDGRDPIKDFLEELSTTEYKESRLYKIVAKALIKDLISDIQLDDGEDLVSDIHVIEEFKTITKYEYDQEDLDNLAKRNIVHHSNGHLCNKSFFKKDSLIDYIIRSRKIIVSRDNIDDLLYILPDYTYIVNEIDDEIINETFYYDHHHYAENNIEKANYYESLTSKINEILQMLKDKEIRVEYESSDLKDKLEMSVFWTISSAAELSANNNYDYLFTKEYLNYYNTFYNGKVIDSKIIAL